MNKPRLRRKPEAVLLIFPDTGSRRYDTVRVLERFFRCGLASLLLVVPVGQASETDAIAFRLSVQPSICVSYNSEEPCTMSMQVSWEGGKPADVCLRDAKEKPMLHCWENTSRGSIAIDYSNTGDALYQLVEEKSLGVLAEAEVKVINRDLRSSRKRRRHVWSIL